MEARVRPTSIKTNPAALPGETELQTRTRLAKRQLTSIIDIFVPPTQPEQPAVRPPRVVLGNEDEAGPNRRRGGGGAEGTRADRKHRSGDLRELVDYYHDTREALKDLFPEVTINVTGRGEIPLRSYFKKVAWAKPDTPGYVYSGGGRIERREGAGFVFRFFDKVADKEAFLQVSNEVMTQHRSRRYVNELLDQARVVRYFTFYFLGTFAYHEAGNTMIAEVTDLRCLAIDLGPLRN